VLLVELELGALAAAAALAACVLLVEPELGTLAAAARARRRSTRPRTSSAATSAARPRQLRH